MMVVLPHVRSGPSADSCHLLRIQGAFEVMAAQPVNYIIEEMEGLLNPSNKASSLCHLFFQYSVCQNANLGSVWVY